MSALGIIGTEVFYFTAGGLVLLLASGFLGYLIIGKILNIDIRVRWFILIGSIIVFSVISCNPNWIATVGASDFQHLRFQLMLRMVPIGFSVGQMFGGEKINLKRKKKNRQEDEDEE
jgi:hypothetical protein